MRTPAGRAKPRRPFLASHPSPRRTAGFSYIEVLIATAMIALMLVPALDGLSIGLLGSSVQIEMTRTNYHLVSLLEEVLAKSFDELETEAATVADAATPTTYSDPPGSADRRLVFLSTYDIDNADADDDPLTGAEDGLLWVRVELENTGRRLETLTSR